MWKGRWTNHKLKDNVSRPRLLPGRKTALPIILRTVERFIDELKDVCLSFLYIHPYLRKILSDLSVLLPICLSVHPSHHLKKKILPHLSAHPSVSFYPICSSVHPQDLIRPVCPSTHQVLSDPSVSKDSCLSLSVTPSNLVAGVPSN